MTRLKLLVTISEERHEKQLTKIYDKNNIGLRTVINASGTATSSLLNYFGLTETQKFVNLAVIPDYLERDILEQIDKDLKIQNPGTGIVFTISISSANKFLLDNFEDKNLERSENMKKYHLIITIVLEGNLEQVMASAKKAGALGGTVIRGRGLGSAEATKLFGFEIEPGRELVLNVVEDSIKNKVMEQITKDVGIKTPCKGICLSIPVDTAIGIDNENYEKN